MTDDQLRRLADESELRDLIHRYAFGLDDRDWTLWRSVFADEVVIDMSDYRPEPPPSLATAEQVVRSAQTLFAGFEATQHFIGTPRIELGADGARSETYCIAHHVFPEDYEGGVRGTRAADKRFDERAELLGSWRRVRHARPRRIAATARTERGGVP